MTTQTPHDDVGADDTLVRIPAQPAEPRPAGRRRRKAPIVLAVAATAVVMLGALYAVALPDGRGQAAAGTRRSPASPSAV